MAETEILTEEECLAEGLMILEEGIAEAAQSRVLIPKKGKLFEADGTCKVSIIRPCVSRGKRLRGLPPIYTPQMLEANASVFTGWLMYMDHLTEAIVEALKKRGRSINDLGGRVIEAAWNPLLTFKDDADFGYQPGGVVGRVLPQPAVRKMIEADPEILNVSINAYPKGARAGTAPWNSAVRGMIVEGIMKVPQGSVDWVPRGGAGGRVLQEGEESFESFAVSMIETFYDPAADADPSREREQMPDFKNLTLEQLQEQVRVDNPELASQIVIPAKPDPAKPEVKEGETLTADQVRQMLAEQDAKHKADLAALREGTEDDLDTRLSEERQAVRNEEFAHALIKAAGLPPRWTTDLKRRYSVQPGGASPALLLEATDDKTVEDLLKEAVQADIQHAVELITESGGRASVRGLGGGGEQEPKGAQKGGAKKNTAFRDFLRESGTLPKTKEDGEKLTEADETAFIKDMVIEGVQ